MGLSIITCYHHTRSQDISKTFDCLLNKLQSTDRKSDFEEIVAKKKTDQRIYLNVKTTILSGKKNKLIERAEKDNEYEGHNKYVSNRTVLLLMTND